MAKNKLSVLQEELRSRLRLLEEDIKSGDEYDPNIYQAKVSEIGFLKKTLSRIWEIKHA